MNHLEFIKSRRSYRSFTKEKVEKEKLQEIVHCGLLAPSGMNTQGIHISVITDETILKQLTEMVGRDFIYSAPALLIVHCDKDYRYAYQDGSCTMTSMYFASEAVGLGACWINQLKDYPLHPMMEVLGLKEQLIIGSLAVGYKGEIKEERDLNLNRVRYI